MIVNFFKSSEDYKHPNRQITILASKDIRLQEDTSVLEPTIEVDAFEGWRDVNCIWIELFNRFYFVSDSPTLKGGRVMYPLHVDVLLTYRQGLMGLTALIDRQEFVYSRYIEDPLLKTRSNRVKEIKKIGSLGTPSGTNYALTVVGGV